MPVEGEIYQKNKTHKKTRDKNPIAAIHALEHLKKTAKNTRKQVVSLSMQLSLIMNPHINMEGRKVTPNFPQSTKRKRS